MNSLKGKTLSNLSSFRRIALVILVGVVAGCTAIQAFPGRQIPSETALENDLLFVPKNVIDGYYTAANDSQKAAIRDKFITNRMAAIDFRYANFLARLQTESTVSGLGADLAILGLSTAGALLPAGGVTRILAATTGAVTGARASYDKNVLLDRTIGALITQMEARRAQIRTRILTRIATKQDARYSLLFVQVDLQEYYFAGTLPGAIAAVTQNAGVAAAEAEQELSEIIDVAITPTFLDLRDLVTGDGGAIIPERAALFETCAGEQSVDLTGFGDDANSRFVMFLLESSEDVQEKIAACVRSKLTS